MFHSDYPEDLVNWEMAGYALDRYDEDPKYDMQGGNLYLNGAWATTIRHHNGKFYVGFCTPCHIFTGFPLTDFTSEFNSVKYSVPCP